MHNEKLTLNTQRRLQTTTPDLRLGASSLRSPQSRSASSSRPIRAGQLPLSTNQSRSASPLGQSEARGAEGGGASRSEVQEGSFKGTRLHTGTFFAATPTRNVCCLNAAQRRAADMADSRDKATDQMKTWKQDRSSQVGRCSEFDRVFLLLRCAA